ncbi:hypothetical protein FDP22_23220 (plasmid) [Paroceanicella profunda]|uniref:Uncharacterized protein n=1 Tax=Paroceanicella profunda TaxID=2579971 RepID=A0A5B8G3R9_9RHOB|nr:hypothetical protein [Paroceanicella profunda]QDL94784.1 hypothetical protein FDP22_23220 [Paroceanicella profunda]
MHAFPFRLLLSAYGSAAILALASWWVGLPGLAAALLFWLSGAGFVFLLPVVFPDICPPRRARSAEDGAPPLVPRGGWAPQSEPAHRPEG